MAGEYEVLGIPGGPLVLGASGLVEIAQNIRVILTTTAWSCALDRRFAGSAGYLDSPAPLVTASRVAEIMEMVERYEPRAKVLGVTFAPDPQSALAGRLFPKVRFKLKE